MTTEDPGTPHQPELTTVSAAKVTVKISPLVTPSGALAYEFAAEGGCAATMSACADIHQGATPLADLVLHASPSRLVVRRNTVRDTWRWLWRDTLGRIIPFYAAVGLYAWRTRRGAAGLGLRREQWVRDALVGTAYGLPLALVAAEFRRRIIPSYRLPTSGDQVFQTAFYFALNAPAEELFFRAMIQSVAIRALQRLGLRPVMAVGAGYAVATALYGSYHRLGGWSWRSIAGVSAAGLLFGALYQWHPRQSLLPSIVAHACATAGFLSWGDVYLHLRARAASL